MLEIESEQTQQAEKRALKERSAELADFVKQKGKELRDFQDEVHELQVAQLEREAEALTKMSIEHSERVNEELQPVRGRVT